MTTRGAMLAKLMCIDCDDPAAEPFMCACVLRGEHDVAVDPAKFDALVHAFDVLDGWEG